MLPLKLLLSYQCERSHLDTGLCLVRRMTYKTPEINTSKLLLLKKPEYICFLIQLVYGTSVVLLVCPFVSEIMHGGVPEVKLESRRATFTVLVQSKKDINPTKIYFYT